MLRNMFFKDVPDWKFSTGSGFMAMKYGGSGFRFSVKCSADCINQLTSASSLLLSYSEQHTTSL